MGNQTTLIIDGYNLLHRSRFNFRRGGHFVTFNFLRSLRALTEMFDPDVLYVALEGTPKRRIEIDPEYKQNRQVDKNSEAYEDLVDFNRQKDETIEIMKKFLPICVVRHPDFEGDDVVRNLAKYRVPQNSDVVVVSSDTDFIQMLNEFDNVRIWNPIKKSFVDRPDYDYVRWKALRGDKTDNIFGVKGIGDKTALKLVKDPDLLRERLSDPDVRNIFEQNIEMIKFHDMKDEIREIEISAPDIDWKKLRANLTEKKMFSLTGDTSWKKFVSTFSKLTEYALWEPKN